MTVFWNSGPVLAAARSAAVRGIVRGTERVRSEADSLMQETPKTGRVYTRRSVAHVASSPGQAPAIDTGRLRQSLRTSYSMGGLTGTVTASTAYAEALEFGTSRVAPRPFMRPALSNNRADIEADIAAEIRGAFGG